MPTQIPLTCPKCLDNDSVLNPLKLLSSAHRPSLRNETEPKICKCSKCYTGFTYRELISSIVQASGYKDELDESDINELMAMDPIIPESVDADGRDLHGLQLTLTLLKCQHHRWYHCKSCFKKTTRVKNGKSCRFSIIINHDRFLFPKMVVGFAHLTESNRILLKRSNGNEWINSYSPLFMRLFKYNHDIKFLT
jgi:hypothetical protein